VTHYSQTRRGKNLLQNRSFIKKKKKLKQRERIDRYQENVPFELKGLKSRKEREPVGNLWQAKGKTQIVVIFD